MVTNIDYNNSNDPSSAQAKAKYVRDSKRVYNYRINSAIKKLFELSEVTDTGFVVMSFNEGNLEVSHSCQTPTNLISNFLAEDNNSSVYSNGDLDDIRHKNPDLHYETLNRENWIKVAKDTYQQFYEQIEKKPITKVRLEQENTTLIEDVEENMFANKISNDIGNIGSEQPKFPLGLEYFNFLDNMESGTVNEIVPFHNRTDNIPFESHPIDYDNLVSHVDNAKESDNQIEDRLINNNDNNIGYETGAVWKDIEDNYFEDHVMKKNKIPNNFQTNNYFEPNSCEIPEAEGDDEFQTNEVAQYTSYMRMFENASDNKVVLIEGTNNMDLTNHIFTDEEILELINNATDLL